MGSKLQQKLKRAAKITGLVFAAGIGLLLLAVAGALVFIDPPLGKFDPAIWKPAPGFGIDPAKTDPETAKSIQPLIEKTFQGPEDIAVDSRDNAYIGTSDGSILRIPAGQDKAEVFAEVGGRPLGLAFDPAGHLIVANQGIGLQSVSPDGTVRLLTGKANGQPISFANDLAVASNGMIYFSDSNSKYNPHTLGDLPSFSLYDFLEGRPRGRLLQYDPATQATKELLSGLYFPNGIALTSDQHAVLVAESTRYRITRYWLEGQKAGTADIFVDNVPGILDGLTSASDGRLLLPMYDRSGALDNLILPHTGARQLLVRVPWLASGGGPAAGSVLILSENGEILRHINNIRPSPSNIVLYKNQWLLGSLSDGQVRVMQDSPEP